MLCEENKNGLSLKRLALKYGISKTAASYIVNGKTYAAAIGTGGRTTSEPIYISPITGKKHRIRRAK